MGDFFHEKHYNITKAGVEILKIFTILLCCISSKTECDVAEHDRLA